MDRHTIKPEHLVFSTEPAHRPFIKIVILTIISNCKQVLLFLGFTLISQTPDAWIVKRDGSAPGHVIHGVPAARARLTTIISYNTVIDVPRRPLTRENVTYLTPSRVVK